MVTSRNQTKSNHQFGALRFSILFSRLFATWIENPVVNENSASLEDLQKAWPSSAIMFTRSLPFLLTFFIPFSPLPFCRWTFFFRLVLVAAGGYCWITPVFGLMAKGCSDGRSWSFGRFSPLFLSLFSPFFLSSSPYLLLFLPPLSTAVLPCFLLSGFGGLQVFGCLLVVAFGFSVSVAALVYLCAAEWVLGWQRLGFWLGFLGF